MTSWLQMRAEDWTLGQATLFDVDDAPAEPIERPGTLFEPAPELVDVGQLAAELDDMKATTKRLNRISRSRRPDWDPSGCGCPRDGARGMIRHQRQTCTDPVAARLDWYAE